MCGEFGNFQSSPVCEPCAEYIEIFREKFPVLGISLRISLGLRCQLVPRPQQNITFFGEENDNHEVYARSRGTLKNFGVKP